MSLFGDLPFPKDAPTDILVSYVRDCAPDVRFKHVELPDGKRACGAKFTFLGRPYEVESVESAEMPDAYDGAVRRCVWIIRRDLGVRQGMTDERRTELERQIVNASLNGDTETEARLALELVTANEAGFAQRIIRTKFER